MPVDVGRILAVVALCFVLRNISRVLSKTAVLLLLPVVISGCLSGSQTVKPVARMSDETLERLNNVARVAASDPSARARSGSRRRRDIAFDAIYYYDRDHTHLFNREIKALWEDYHNDYIDDYEYHEEFTRVFVNLGVVENRNYRDASDRYLLRLDGTYRLSPNSNNLLRELYPQSSLKVPVIQVIAAADSGLHNNFNRGDLSVLDPRSVARIARLFNLDESELTEAIALHEAHHHVLGQALTGRKSAIITQHLSEISDTTDNIVRFHHWREVDEFLADAAQIMINRAGLRYAAARIVRAGPSLGVMKKPGAGATRSRRKRPHDASALFVYRLLLRYELASAKVSPGINDIRESLALHHESDESISAEWIRTTWLPWIDRTFTPHLEQHIRDRYRTVASRILTILRNHESDTQLTSQ